MNEKESPNEADANEAISLEMTEMDAKQNDINKGFRRFFSNIGLKLTVDRGSGEIPTDVPNDTDTEEPNRPEDVEDATKETTSENAEQDSDVNVAQETYDNDSTTCPTMTEMTSEEVLENAEEKETETKAEVESSNADAAMTSPLGEDANQDTTTEEEPRSTSPSSPEEEAAVSPIRRFFTTGIFSGLQKKKNLEEDETTGKEMKDIGKKEVVEKTEQTVQDQQRDKEDVSVGVEAAAAETMNAHEENKPKGEIRSAARTMDASPDPLTIIVTEPEVLSSQEKDKVQASPLKRLLSGSGLKKLSKKQRGRKSSDVNLSDSGEHVSDHNLSSTDTAENQKEEGGAQPSTERVGEEDGAWASFKRLLTPKKRMKRSSLSNEETQIPGSVEEPKPKENKKRKDSSVSWDAVLCRSGRRRSRKTSDSDDETPQIDNRNKQDGGSKNADSALANEVDDILASSPEQAGSPSEGEGASTWKSLKRLVTPKRKAKDDKESKDHVQSDSEVSQDEYSFSIKKLLPGRKKRKSAEKQDHVSSDEADNEAASGDEDSDTPAVVPLSEFDTVETEVHIQTQANVESHHIPKEADFELQQDRLDPMAEPALPCDNLQTEAKTVQGNDDASENQATTTPDANEKADDLTESDQISKQQLSDIPEEATPASATEDAARDDTIAEDLIEITSEAITAAEHLDITLADETEMISAVSQLSSESSKTSGNTTPVPAEYVVEETDVLLHQVVETISISPETVPVYILSEVPTEEYDTAEITGGEVQEVDVTHPENSVTELESIDESYYLVECLSEGDATGSTNRLPEGDKIVPDKGSLIEAHQTETEHPKLDHQETDLAATVANETKDGAMEQEVPSLTNMEDQVMHNITDQIQAEDFDQQPVEVEDLQELADAQVLTLGSEKGGPSLEEDIISEAIAAGETV
uniref:A kinase-anchoring proteins AKAP-5 and AKAP-12 calmodulin (CaM)-binding domain-containing protein n=1 Tax=Cyclopterus lumpus TaxID=8103 RepID=A0A8C3G5Q0_CYCLU